MSLHLVVYDRKYRIALKPAAHRQCKPSASSLALQHVGNLVWDVPWRAQEQSTPLFHALQL